MKVLVYTVIIIGILFSSPTIYAQKATWKSNADNSNWNTPTNWLDGIVPGVSSEVEIYTCLNNCPDIPGNITIGSLYINGGGVNLQNYVLSVNGNTQLIYSKIISNKGKISSLYISEVKGNTFNGISPYDFDELTIERKDGTGTMWSGGNTYNCPVIITNRSLNPTFYVQRYLPDTFYEPVVINNYGYGMLIGQTIGTNFHSKVTLNNISQGSGTWSGSSCSFVRAICHDEYIANNPSLGVLYISGTFKKTVRLNNQQPGPDVTYATYGNKIVVGNDAYSPVTTFEGRVIITNTSQRSAAYSGVDIDFNPTIATTSCLFTPNASLAVDTDASGKSLFLKGNLILRNCTFQTTQTTNLNLSSGTTPEANVSQLIIANGASFIGPLQAKAPYILLNGAVFTQEATFIKTGVNPTTDPNKHIYGTITKLSDNSLGGNRFKKKVTLINQALGNSPMNLATIIDDIIQQ